MTEFNLTGYTPNKIKHALHFSGTGLYVVNQSDGLPVPGQSTILYIKRDGEIHLTPNFNTDLAAKIGLKLDAKGRVIVHRNGMRSTDRDAEKTGHIATGEDNETDPLPSTLRGRDGQLRPRAARRPQKEQKHVGGDDDQ